VDTRAQLLTNACNVLKCTQWGCVCQKNVPPHFIFMSHLLLAIEPPAPHRHSCCWDIEKWPKMSKTPPHEIFVWGLWLASLQFPAAQIPLCSHREPHSATNSSHFKYGILLEQVRQTHVAVSTQRVDKATNLLHHQMTINNLVTRCMINMLSMAEVKLNVSHLAGK